MEKKAGTVWCPCFSFIPPKFRVTLRCTLLCVSSSSNAPGFAVSEEVYPPNRRWRCRHAKVVFFKPFLLYSRRRCRIVGGCARFLRAYFPRRTGGVKAGNFENPGFQERFHRKTFFRKYTDFRQYKPRHFSNGAH